MGKIRCGVIGLNIGGTHIANYLKCKDAELVALCDRDEKWLNHVSKETCVKALYKDYREMLADKNVDAVSVCLPNFLHAPVTIEALKAGKHVLCEKPMAINVKEAAAMVAASKKYKRTLMINQNQRFVPKAKLLKHYVDKGFFGKIYFARINWIRPMGIAPTPNAVRATGEYNRNWFNKKANGGGVLRDLGSHLLDLTMWLMGSPEPKEALGANYAVFTPGYAKAFGEIADAEDFGTGMIKFKNGAAAHLVSSFGSHTDAQTVFVELYGTKGGARLVNQEELRLFSSNENGFYEVKPLALTLPDESVQDNFIKAIKTGKEPLVTGKQALNVIKTLDMIYKSGVSLEFSK